MKRLIQIRMQELCQEIELDEQIIKHFIEEEWVMPFDQSELIFDDEDLARITLIHELQQEFGVNDEAVPIILNLLDQLNLLRAEIKKLNQSK